MARIGWGKMLAGAVGVGAGLAAAGAAWFYLREKGIETPPHETLDSDGAFEIRQYPAILVAETIQPGSRDRALGNGLGLLADYFFAESREGDEVAMTAPLFAVKGGNGWTMRIATPAKLGRDELPAPGDGVAIVEIPARKMAVLRFGGRADDRMLAAKEGELRRWIEGRWLDAMGPIEHAFYNSPVMPGPLRSNEVMIPIADRRAETTP